MENIILIELLIIAYLKGMDIYERIWKKINEPKVLRYLIDTKTKQMDNMKELKRIGRGLK